jgi:hypothetical protein
MMAQLGKFSYGFPEISYLIGVFFGGKTSVVRKLETDNCEQFGFSEVELKPVASISRPLWNYLHM